MTDTVAGGMANMRIRSLALWMGLVAVPCYIIDQATKWLVHSRMDIGEGFTVVPGFLDIIHARNTGAAFGMLQGMPVEYRTLFFAAVTVIACGAILVIFWRSPDDSWLLKLVFSLIIAGALGNLTDRFLFGEVVDFLSFHVGRFRWPTFNMADTWISLGMVGLLIQSFFMPEKEP